MDVTDAHLIEVTEQSQVSDARRQIVAFAHNHGFDEATEHRLALVCTELGTNLLKHTPHGGKLIVQGMTEGNNVGVEVFSIDSGNGMNVDDCMKDGYSSTGTYGTGLGAIQRLTDSFDIYSAFGAGVVVQTRVWTTKANDATDFSFGGLTVPKSGEQLSGDKWIILRDGTTIYSLLVDGLGHGIEACEAARLAIKRFRENLHLSPAAMIKAIHTALRGTRGAVATVAKLDLQFMRLDYCGLGNIAGIAGTSGAHKHLTNLNGTLGYEARKILEFTMPWAKDSILIMHSDGLSSKALLEDISAVEAKSAPLIAAWLYQKHCKSIDDATVLVMKQLSYSH
jgi:anti-sigma regulatory factor (Ser/Thr protein kinase)